MLCVIQVSQAQLEAIGYRLQTTGLLGVVQVSQAQLEAIGYRLQATGLLGVGALERIADGKVIA